MKEAVGEASPLVHWFKNEGMGQIGVGKPGNGELVPGGGESEGARKENL